MKAMQFWRATRICRKRTAALAALLCLVNAAASQPVSAAKNDKEETPQPAPILPILPALPQVAPNQTPAKELKSLKTPFGHADTAEPQADGSNPLAGFGLDGHAGASPHHLSLQDRLLMPRLYLPGHMVLGKTVEFTVKAKPGNWVALAMADKDSGAKPVMGHKIRLGPDRKVVAAGQIPANGVLVLNLETPIEGDLIGQCLYFEAAVWSSPDMSDTEFASVVSSESQKSAANGVLIAADTAEKKHGIKIVPDGAAPILTRQHPGTFGLESGKP